MRDAIGSAAGVTEGVGRRQKTRGALILPWPAVALGLAIVCIALLGALVVITNVKNVDTLSTVALVLAILSFGAQLIVTAAQTMSSNEQHRQVNRLYEDTRSVLQKIRSQSKMLLSNQSDQFNKVLDHVLSPSAIESAVAEVQGDGDGENSDREPVADAAEVSKLLRAEAERAISEDRTLRSATAIDRDKQAQLWRRFPTEAEGAEVARRVAELSPEARDFLFKAAGSSDPKPPALGGRVLNVEFSKVPPYLTELEAAGLVQLDPVRRSGATLVGRRFTTDGLVALRFFSARGIVPQYLRHLLAQSLSAPEATPAKPTGPKRTSNDD